jgi:hypothetical protein
MVKKVVKLLNILSGCWVGFGCGWIKLNVVQFGLASAVACTSFNFAKRWHFSVRLLSVVSVF